jgi:protein-L-isoaspartate(D-aspartate) O-methyltransferase
MNYLDKAFAAIPRRNFLPAETADQAELDVPLPIGFGQTNSQPTTVAMMLDWLEVMPGHKVLDIGAGSGWTSALLSFLVGPNGHVHAIEIIPELMEFAEDNCARLGIKNVDFHQAGQQYGWPQAAPYDRILVSASAKVLPQELFDQLKPGGRMVVPVGNSIYVINKDQQGVVTKSEKPGFRFVPLVHRGD